MKAEGLEMGYKMDCRRTQAVNDLKRKKAQSGTGDLQL